MTATKLNCLLSRPPLTTKKVGIQGALGSYHHQAADLYLNSIEKEVVPIDTFHQLFNDLKNGKIDYAIVALENSIAGLIHTNYNLLARSNAKIIGEINLPINHHLLALNNCNLEDVKEIHSHPMAILQCLDLLNEFELNGVKIVETIDTALSAKYITENKIKDIAAIASSQAAEMYNLNILKSNIQSQKNNYTRFVCLTMDDTTREFEPKKLESRIKTTFILEDIKINFHLPEILSLFNQCEVDINLLIPLRNFSSKESYNYIIDATCLSHYQIAEIKKLAHNHHFHLNSIGIYESRS